MLCCTFKWMGPVWQLEVCRAVGLLLHMSGILSHVPWPWALGWIWPIIRKPVLWHLLFRCISSRVTSPRNQENGRPTKALIEVVRKYILKFWKTWFWIGLSGKVELTIHKADPDRWVKSLVMGMILQSAVRLNIACLDVWTKCRMFCPSTFVLTLE